MGCRACLLTIGGVVANGSPASWLATTEPTPKNVLLETQYRSVGLHYYALALHRRGGKLLQASQRQLSAQLLGAGPELISQQFSLGAQQARRERLEQTLQFGIARQISIAHHQRERLLSTGAHDEQGGQGLLYRQQHGIAQDSRVGPCHLPL